MRPSALLVGLLAGLASALLFAGVVTQSAGAVALALLAPVPIMLASLGWGSASGFAAALAAFGAIAAATGSVQAGATVLAQTALPSAILGHMAGLARPADEDVGRAAGLDWFPVRRLLFAATLLAAVSSVVLGILTGFSRAEMTEAVTQALSAQAMGANDAQTQQIAELVRHVIVLIPFVQPALLLLTLIICLYVSAAIARASGRLQRPRDDLPVAVAMPRVALSVFALALAGSFLGGPAGLVGEVFVGAFALAFTLAGLATLHRRTRGRAARPLILFTTYAAIALLAFPLIFFLVLGLFETAKPAARAADAS